MRMTRGKLISCIEAYNARLISHVQLELCIYYYNKLFKGVCEAFVHYFKNSGFADLSIFDDDLYTTVGA